jgi:hypothetical protein
MKPKLGRENYLVNNAAVMLVESGVGMGLSIIK